MLNTEQRTNSARLYRAVAFCLALALALGLAGCGKKTPQDLLEGANKALERGDMIGVEIQCRKILEQAPESPEALQARFLIASVRMRSGQFEDARQALSEVIKKTGLASPAGQKAYQDKVAIWVHEKKYDEVIAYIAETSTTLASSPDFAWNTQHVLAQVYVQKGDREKAFEIYKALQASASSEAYVRVVMDDMAALYVAGEKPDFAAAIALYQEHIDKYPESKFYGRLLRDIGQGHQRIAEDLKEPKAKAAEEKKADEALTLCLEYFQTELEEELITEKKIQLAMQVVGMHYLMKNLDKALEALEEIGKQLEQENPGAPMPLGLTAQIAETLVELKKTDEAIKRLEKGIEDHIKHPERGFLMQILVQIYEDANNTEDARKWLERMQKDFPMTNVSLLSEGRVMVLDKKFAEAKTHFEQMQAQFQGTPVLEQANSLLAYTLEKALEAGVALTTGTTTLSTATLSLDAGATTPTAANDLKSTPTAASSAK